LTAKELPASQEGLCFSEFFGVDGKTSLMFRQKWEYNKAVHQLFIDFKKAYGSVRKEALYNILTESGNPNETGKADKHVSE
jgi:hypothetical protein